MAEKLCTLRKYGGGSRISMIVNTNDLLATLTTSTDHAEYTATKDCLITGTFKASRTNSANFHFYDKNNNDLGAVAYIWNASVALEMTIGGTTGIYLPKGYKVVFNVPSGGGNLNVKIYGMR